MTTITPLMYAQSRHRKPLGLPERDTGTKAGSRAVNVARHKLRTDATAMPNTTKADVLVAWAVSEHVIGHGRLGDYVRTATIASLTGVSEGQVRKCLKKLADAAVIVREHSDHGGQWLGVVTRAELVALHEANHRGHDDPGTADRGAQGLDEQVEGARTGCAQVRAHAARHRSLVSTLINEREGGTVGAQEHDEPPPGPAGMQTSGTTATTTSLLDLIAALSDRGTTDDRAQAAARAGGATSRAAHHAAAMLAAGERHTWPRQVADAIAARATTDTLDRYTRPQCNECNGHGVVLDLDGTTAQLCQACRTGQVPQLSPQPSTSSPSPLALQHHGPPSMPQHSTGIMQARKALAPEYVMAATDAETPHTETGHLPPATTTRRRLERHTGAVQTAVSVVRVRSWDEEPELVAAFTVTEPRRQLLSA